MAGIINFSEQGSAPPSPTAGRWNIYSTSDGFGIQDSTGGTGLLPILSGNATDFLNGLGAWGVPGGSSTDLTNHTHASTDEGGLIRLDTITAPTDSTSLDSSTDMHGLLPKLNGTSDNYLNGIGEWAYLLPSPALYERDIAWVGSTDVVTTPNKLWVNVNDKLRTLSTQTTLPLGTASSWDSTDDYTSSSDRAGKDFYIYACDDNVLAPTLKLSLHSV
jgi:hypothetical protein